MNEAILKFAWKHRFYNPTNLTTTNGLSLTVLKPGRENFDAGPDFFLADLKIDDTRWVGNVEIHVKSSDWLRHGHQSDTAYNNVTLHVVYEHDREIQVNGVVLPTLELKESISRELIQKYEQIAEVPFKFLPCEAGLKNIEKVYVSSWVNRMFIERISQRVAQITQLYNSNNHDLVETFYQCLLVGFGRTVNKEAFLQLARSCPYSLVKKYLHDPGLLEALLFGQAGLLPEESDQEYVQLLAEKYLFLRRKHGLIPMRIANWKFLRMRPANFPPLRIAQLSSLLSEIDLSELFQLPLSELPELNVTIDSFWNEHYSFSISLVKKEKRLGEDFKRHLLINVFAPFRVFYLQHKGEGWEDEVENFFQHIPPEKNKLLSKLAESGFENLCGSQSQGLLQLYNLYCEQKKCLLCSIGYQILRG